MKLRSLYVVMAGLITAVTALIGVPAVASASPAAAPVAYPATVCSSISVSTTNPALGEKIAVSGTAFRPNALFSDWLLVGYSTAYTHLPLFSLVMDRDIDEGLANLYCCLHM